MKRLFALLLCVLLLLSATACKKNKDAGTEPQIETEETAAPAYAHDPLINRFFVDYIGLYGHKALDTQSIRRGNNVKEYIATIEECPVTLRNVSYETTPDDGSDPTTVYQMRVIIQGGTTEESLDRMMKAFSQITRCIDPECLPSTANEAIEHLKKQTTTLSDYRFCYYVQVDHYTPINKEVGVPAKIELLALNYVVEDAAN